jgi:uncharacterized protein (DUF3820 family)
MPKSSEKLTDTTVMWFGAHKGKMMANIPAKYLLWLLDSGKCPLSLHNYINENLDALKTEVKNG